MMDRNRLKLYLVTDRTLTRGRDLTTVVQKAVEGGVTMVQLREKEASSKEFYELALQLKNCLKEYDVPLIINDRLDIALAVDADGLHIGQKDLPYEIARKLLGPDKIIGLSIENYKQAEECNNFNIDYIGISPVFDTATKSDTAKALGLEGIKEISRRCKHPSVGIGGINRENASQIIHAGADGISVVSAIMSAENPKIAAEELIQIMKKRSSNEVEFKSMDSNRAYL